jgi:hypothetical protein
MSAALARRIYDWAKVNVAGDGNCFYRSLYEAAKFHTNPDVLGRLLDCFGMTIENNAESAADVPAAAEVNAPLKVTKEMIEEAQQEEDDFCTNARFAITMVLMSNGGEILDRLVGDVESPYSVFKTQIQFFITTEFNNLENLFSNLIDDVVESRLAALPDEESGDTIFRIFMSYFSPSLPDDLRTDLQASLLHTITVLAGANGEGANAPPQIDPKTVTPYIRDDLDISTLPTANRTSIQEQWEMILMESSDKFREVFGDVLDFPESRLEYAERYATVIAEENEFTTELDINIINTIMEPCGLVVHTLSSRGPKRVITPEGVDALYVLLDSDGEHYNFIVAPSVYKKHQNLLNKLARFKPKKIYYKRAELFLPDSVGVEEHPSEPVPEEPVPTLPQTRKLTFASKKKKDEERNIQIKSTLANMGITENMENYKNMYAAVKAQLQPAAASQGGKRRFTQKKGRD